MYMVSMVHLCYNYIDSYTPDGTLSSVKVDPPRVISLTDTEQRLALITYKKQLIDIGI